MLPVRRNTVSWTLRKTDDSEQFNEVKMIAKSNKEGQHPTSLREGCESRAKFHSKQEQNSFCESFTPKAALSEFTKMSQQILLRKLRFLQRAEHCWLFATSELSPNRKGDSCQAPQGTRFQMTQNLEIYAIF